MRALIAIVLFLISVPALAQAPEPAAGLEDAVKLFLSDDFADTEKAVSEIAASGSPGAAEVLSALKEGRLYFSPATVVYKSAAGTYIDAASGKAAEIEPGDLSPVRLNNRLRSIVQGALGSLTLSSPDRATRLAAAAAVFKSKDPSAKPGLLRAVEKEQDPDVKSALKGALAAVVLAVAGRASQAELREAIASMAERGDQDALFQLKAALPAIKDNALKQEASRVIGQVELRLKAVAMAQNVWYGLSLGSVLLLTAIGLAITFGVMGVINMAHGEMAMLGAYTTFVVQEVFRGYAPDYLGLSLMLAVPLAFMVTGLIGIGIERGVIRFLYGRPLETLLATWGISLILQQAVRTFFGPSNREVAAPSYMSGSLEVLGLHVTQGRLWIIVLTLIIFAAFLIILKTTRYGVQMRAVTQNRKMASAMGINTPLIDAMTFGLGSGIAGVAGVALSQIDNVSPNLGQTYIIDSFMVVVFGGVGSLWGTLVSAFALGIANKFLEPVAGAVLGKIAILVLLIIFIQKRPRGLFALKGRAVEA